MAPSTGLGRYLRARRELVRPAEVGLPDGGRRRVPGLRREELAMLARISPDYYLRLEQGRDRHPSAQVVGALAVALRLDPAATDHLHVLSSLSPAPRLAAGEPERAPAAVVGLIATWPRTPAVVLGRHMDVLAANTLATAISPALRPGANLLRSLFLDPDVRRLHVAWEERVAGAVAGLRANVGPDVDDPRLVELVADLSARSEPFRRLWARHDVRAGPARVARLDHPVVGPLELAQHELAIAGAAGQVLVAGHAAPGSASDRALARLA